MEAVFDNALALSAEDDGKLFVIRVTNTGEQRIARYHFHMLAGHRLKFPCFADPDNPEDYRCWLHEGWGGQAVRRLASETAGLDADATASDQPPRV